MGRLEQAFGPWVIRHRWWILPLTLIAVLAAASGGRFLTFTTNYRVFFSEDNPQLLAFDALERTYTKNDNIMLVLAPRDGNVFTREHLAAVEWLTRAAWQLPYSSRVDSLTNFQHTEARGDELRVHDLVRDARALSDQEIARVRAIALQEPLLVRRLVSDDGSVAAVNVVVQLPGVHPEREAPEAVAYARRLAAQVKAAHPDVDVHLTGIVMMNNAFSEASQGDLRSLVPLSFAAMLVILGLLLRGVTVTLATLLVIAFSITTAMGLGGYLGIPLTPPSASAPIIILTVAVANSVHVLVTFVYNWRHGMARHAALAESLRVNLQPVFLASATTALGFLSMNFAEVPPFRHLGNLVAMGVAASFLLSITFLPALLAVLPLRVKPVRDGTRSGMSRFGAFVVRRRTPLLWGMAALVIGLSAFVPRNELNDVFLHYFDDRVPFRSDSDFTVEHLTGLYQIDYSLQSGQSGGLSDPDFLRDVDAFVEWYRAQPETVHVMTITDILKRLNRNMHGDDPAWYRLPERRDLAAQYLLLYEMSLPYGLDLNNQIDVDKSATRVGISLETLSTRDLLALARRAAAWLQAHAPHIARAEASGPSLMFAHIGHRNIITMLVGTTVALVCISLLLVLALRSVRIGLTSMVPNLVPAAMGFGLWGLLVGEVGLALSVVTGMTLGIVVDDTVHYLSKYLRGRREKGLAPPQAVIYAFTVVGRALVTTSVVLVVGFLVLALSAFKLNSAMGLLTAVVIAFALLADFLLLPPLLMKIEERRHAKLAELDTVSDPAAG